jgi:solute carrier family 25 citrate transporter 1
LLADKNGKVSFLNGFLAGLGSGMTEAVLIVTPFEVIKTRLQQQKGTDKATLKYHGPVHAFQTIIKEEGVTALWKGNVPTMWRQGINQLLLFGTYDYMKNLFFGLNRDDPISPVQSLVIGIIAGALGPLCNNPLDVAKTRLMAQMTVPGEKPKYRGTFGTISRVLNEEGPRALMRGCIMRIIRVAPGMGITFTVVEMVSERFSDY